MACLHTRSFFVGLGVGDSAALDKLVEAFGRSHDTDAFLRLRRVLYHSCVCDEPQLVEILSALLPSVANELLVLLAKLRRFGQVWTQPIFTITLPSYNTPERADDRELIVQAFGEVMPDWLIPAMAIVANRCVSGLPESPSCDDLRFAKEQFTAHLMALFVRWDITPSPDEPLTGPLHLASAFAEAFESLAQCNVDCVKWDVPELTAAV